jgi:hypothetical protein
MRKLIGKIRQAFRRERYTERYAPQTAPDRSRRGQYRALDHVLHYHVEGEAHYLCGKLYRGYGDVNDATKSGPHRTANTHLDVTCNTCQRTHNHMLTIKEGRARLGLTH